MLRILFQQNYTKIMYLFYFCSDDELLKKITTWNVGVYLTQQLNNNEFSFNSNQFHKQHYNL